MTTTTPTFTPLAHPPEKFSLRPRATILLSTAAAGYLLALSNLPLHLPTTCPFKLATGLPCAACGLTHAFCALANFHPLTALHYNLSVLPLALLVTTTTALLLAELATNRPYLSPFFKKTNRLLLWSLPPILLLAWSINLFNLWPA